MFLGKKYIQTKFTLVHINMWRVDQFCGIWPAQEETGLIANIMEGYWDYLLLGTYSGIQMNTNIRIIVQQFCSRGSSLEPDYS